MQGDQQAVANPHSSGGVQLGPKKGMQSQRMQLNYQNGVDDSEDNALEENLNDIEMINIDLIE